MIRYEEIMDRIVVTDAMRERILGRIRRQQSHTHRMRPATRWLTILAAAAGLIIVCGAAYTQFGSRNLRTASEAPLSVAATDEAAVADEAAVTSADADAADARGAANGTGAKDANGAAESAADSVENDSAMVSSAVYAPEQFGSAAELSAYVGFEIDDLTTVPFAIASVEYYAIDEELAEIDYYSMGTVCSLCYRKSVGTDDNSGDYNTYEVVVDAAIGEHPLTLSGNGDRYYLATWNDGTYAYSIRVSDGCSENELLAIVQEIME